MEFFNPLKKHESKSEGAPAMPPSIETGEEEVSFAGISEEAYKNLENLLKKNPESFPGTEEAERKEAWAQAVLEVLATVAASGKVLEDSKQ